MVQIQWLCGDGLIETVEGKRNHQRSQHTLKLSACLGGGGGAKRKPMTTKIKHLRLISAVVGGQCGGGSPQ